MAIHTFAAIYIGSYEVSLKIFEISARKNIRKIDYIRSRIELGRDAYSRGVIGYELVEALCDTLEQFTKIMKEYQVDGYEAYAAAALRDVSNELFILDQIRIRTGLTVHVLSNSEHRFISYKSVAMRSEFEEMIKTGAAVVDVGGGGMQITIFSKGKVITTQHLGLGTIRMQEQLAKKSCSLEQYELQIEELVEKELNVFMAMFTEQVKVKNLIIIGDYIMEVAGKVTGKKHENLMETNDFLAFLDDLDKKTVEQISEELNLSNENDSLIIPYMIIFKCMARKMKAEKIWAPGVIVSDGIAYDYAQKHKLCKLAIKNSASLRQPEYAATWIYRIMLNEIFHHLKRPDTISYEDSLIAEGKPDQYQDLDLRTALDSLSPEDKAIVELRYFEDLKIEDIARVLNENVNTIKSRLYRSMQKLKLKMEVTE
jgi:exopolyphosphatase/guanosine-5'-triphosphate,3'-diphosphate pyrophosphatase